MDNVKKWRKKTKVTVESVDKDNTVLSMNTASLI
jgi:hypothetical protein